MTDEVIISVRGEARRSVDPDSVLLHAHLAVAARGGPKALERLGEAIDRLTGALAGLGGHVHHVDDDRSDLTWSVGSFQSRPTRVADNRRLRPTDTHLASATVSITVRRFDLLTDLTGVLGADEALSVHGVNWRVDRENPAWREVRSEAIAEALAKGADYAGALGGSISGIIEIADTGLLGAPTTFSDGAPMGRAMPASAAAPGIDLDPVPQHLHAAVDARLRATGINPGE